MVHFNFLGEIKKQTMAYYHDRRVGLKYPRGVNSFTFLVVVQNDRKQSLWACDVTHMNTAIEYLCCTIFLLPPFLTFQFLLCIIPSRVCTLTRFSLLSLFVFSNNRRANLTRPDIIHLLLVSNGIISCHSSFSYFIEFIQQLQSSRQAEDVSILQLELDDIFFYKPIRIDQLQLVHLYPPQISRGGGLCVHQPFYQENGSRK